MVEHPRAPGVQGPASAGAAKWQRAGCRPGCVARKPRLISRSAGARARPPSPSCSDADRRDQIASCGSRGRLSAGRQEQGPLGAWKGCRGIAASGERPGSTPGHSARPPEGYATGGRPQRLRYTRAAGCRSFREKTLPWSCPSAMSSCRKMRFSRSLEGKRMASGHTGNVVPGNRLWVRVPCPPLVEAGVDRAAGCPRITV